MCWNDEGTGGVDSFQGEERGSRDVQNQDTLKVQERGEDAEDGGGDCLLTPDRERGSADSCPGSSVVVRRRDGLVPL